MARYSDTQLQHPDEARIERDRTLTRAFAGGNYANAYEGDDYAIHEDTIAGFSHEYQVAFILGFFAAYERHEVPYEHAVAYEEALAHPAALRLRELGTLDRCFIETDSAAARRARSGANA
jgi:hypothetical protein